MNKKLKLNYTEENIDMYIDYILTFEVNSDVKLKSLINSLMYLKVKCYDGYEKLDKLVDLDDWLTRLQNSETHSDIIDL